MKNEELFEKVKKIVAEQLGCDEEKITPESTFIADLGADSLDVVELLMCFEEEFNVEISDGDAEGLTTINHVIKYIETNIKE